MGFKSSNPFRYKRREIKNFIVKSFGFFSIMFGLAFLGILLFNIIKQGYGSFLKTKIKVDVDLSSENLSNYGFNQDEFNVDKIDFYSLFKDSVYSLVDKDASREVKRSLTKLFSIDADSELAKFIKNNPEKIGITRVVKLSANSNFDQIVKGKIDISKNRTDSIFNQAQKNIYGRFNKEGRISLDFNFDFFRNSDSRSPEQAGILGALKGSFFSILICLTISFPIAFLAAIYLEEFAPKNKFFDFVEININNLASVPSIIFGLLGLAVIVNWLSVPRGSALAGGMVLSLMCLPVIIIAARSAIRAVPHTIRDAALALGASKVQSTIHHIVPAAIPGTITGAIIALSRALGETAPLLMIGMLAFIADIPKNIYQPTSSLPVQIYLWAESAERGFVEKSSGVIIILLCFLFIMNGLGSYVRNKFEKRW